MRVRVPPWAPKFAMNKPKSPNPKFLWTPDLAYIAGLLTTDGNMSKDGRHIVMRSSDKDLLKTFNSCLKIKNKIATTHNNGYAKRPSYRVQYSNASLYRWFVTVGLKPAKTYTIGALKIPKKFFRDFLRGHLDGDGYIQHYIDTYNEYKGKRYSNKRIYTRFISASKKHIYWLYNMTIKCLPVKGAIIFKKGRSEKHVPMWEIKFAKYASLKLLKWLYYRRNLPYLNRKRRTAEKLIASNA